MSGSDWRKFAKVIGLASAAFLILTTIYFGAFTIGNRSGYYKGQQERAARQYPGDTQRIVDGCFQLPTRAQTSECVSEAYEASHENQRAEKDLTAQRDMADWAWWAMILGLLQFFATIATLGFVKLTLDATLEAVKDTSAATEAMDKQTKLMANAQRPWLDFKIEVTGISPFAQEGQVNLQVLVEATNHSTFPAHKVITVARAVEGAGLGANAKQDELADEIDDYLSDARRADIGEAIFPQMTESLYANLTIEDRAFVPGEPIRTLSAILGVRYFFEGGEGRTLKGFTLIGIDSFVAFHRAHPNGKRDVLNAIDRGPTITVGPSIFQTRAT